MSWTILKPSKGWPQRRACANRRGQWCRPQQRAQGVECCWGNWSVDLLFGLVPGRALRQDSATIPHRFWQYQWLGFRENFSKPWFPINYGGSSKLAQPILGIVSQKRLVALSTIESTCIISTGSFLGVASFSDGKHIQKEGWWYVQP